LRRVEAGTSPQHRIKSSIRCMADIRISDDRKDIGVKFSFLTDLFAFPIQQSFFSTYSLFLSFGLHACRPVIPRIPQCRNANRFSLFFCRYISDKDTFSHFLPKPYPCESQFHSRLLLKTALRSFPREVT
jgi:hypothetical protein